MLIQRFTVQSVRRCIHQQNAYAPHKTALSRFATPAAIATSHYRIQSRHAATTPASNVDAYSILEKQRLNRPVAPHLTIYRPQVTWYLSALNRITGTIASGGFYIFGAAYLAAPLFGWHIESATMAASFGAWPVMAKVAVKFGVALPFTFHSFNGIRHLVWDMGLEMKNKQVQRSGWTVVGLSVLSAGVLAYV